MTSEAKCNGRPAPVLIRAARANDDFMDVEIREYQRREDELRQSRIAAAAAAGRASTSSSAENHDVNILRNNNALERSLLAVGLCLKNVVPNFYGNVNAKVRHHAFLKHSVLLLCIVILVVSNV